MQHQIMLWMTIGLLIFIVSMLVSYRILIRISKREDHSEEISGFEIIVSWIPILNTYIMIVGGYQEIIRYINIRRVKKMLKSVRDNHKSTETEQLLNDIINQL